MLVSLICLVFKEVSLLLDKKIPVPSSFGEIKLQVSKSFIKIHNYNAIQFVSFYYMNKYKMKIDQFWVGHEMEKQMCCIFGGLIYRKKCKVKLFCRSRITPMYHTLLLDGQIQIIKNYKLSEFMQKIIVLFPMNSSKKTFWSYHQNIICIKLSVNYSKD